MSPKNRTVPKGQLGTGQLSQTRPAQQPHLPKPALKTNPNKLKRQLEQDQVPSEARTPLLRPPRLVSQVQLVARADPPTSAGRLLRRESNVLSGAAPQNPLPVLLCFQPGVPPRALSPRGHHAGSPTHWKHRRSALPGPGLGKGRGLEPTPCEDSPRARRTCSATATFASSCPLLPGLSCRTHVKPLKGTGNPGITTWHQNRCHPLGLAWTNLVRNRGVPRCCRRHTACRRSTALHNTGDRGTGLGTSGHLPPGTKLDGGFSLQDCSFCFKSGFSQFTLICTPRSFTFPRRDQQQLAGDARTPPASITPSHPQRLAATPTGGLALTHSVRTAQELFSRLHKPSRSRGAAASPSFATKVDSRLRSSGGFRGSLRLGTGVKTSKPNASQLGQKQVQIRTSEVLVRRLGSAVMGWGTEG